ncbi:MAG: hypothetical protein ACK5M3_05535 [Dysgonomonas sp.]
MTSNEAYKKIIESANLFILRDKKPENRRIFCRKVPINKGGYTSAGVYFGIGKPLYVEYTSDMEYVRFFRR